MTGPIAQQTSGTSTVQRGGSGSSSLADVVDLILEKGLVIDIYARVSLVGIEILTVDVRIVVASVDTYLRFAKAVNRLDIAHDGTSQGLPQFVEGMQESGAKKKTRGALEGAGERLKETFGGGSDDDEEEDGDKQPARRRSSRKKEDDE
ncbi:MULTISPECIES: gas vesicle protein GvpJ [Actinomadura]|uniref:Gas vesicle protein A n=2 Tax=Actinomadura TaxID=1988 RepID=A0A7D3VNZ4_ACTVE|nr:MULTISPECIES: gas vesicle protein GvpJ [Actinomadura]MBO2460909.1 gas vesicle structural protein GvpA [Actinomadura violacea]QKG19058.1 gas vesicle synthesis-like protein [Actinomadura verrucosospora]